MRDGRLAHGGQIVGRRKPRDVHAALCGDRDGSEMTWKVSRPHLLVYQLVHPPPTEARLALEAFEETPIDAGHGLALLPLSLLVQGDRYGIGREP